MSTFGKWVGQNLLFTDILESDDRVPCMIFSMPQLIINVFHMEDDGNGNKFGLLLPHLEFWIALVNTLIIGAIFSSCISCIMYYFIVIPQKQSKKSKKQNNNITPFLIGFGFIMPICAISPYYGLRYLGVKSKIFKFLFGIAQLTTFFRCSEGMMNT